MPTIGPAVSDTATTDEAPAAEPRLGPAVSAFATTQDDSPPTGPRFGPAVSATATTGLPPSDAEFLRVVGGTLRVVA